MWRNDIKNEYICVPEIQQDEGKWDEPQEPHESHYSVPGLILGVRPANERRRYTVTPSLIGWVQT